LIIDEKVFSAVAKGLSVTVLSMGVNYLRNIGAESAELNINVVKMQTELRGLMFRQNEINQEMKERLMKLSDKVEKLEERKLKK